MRTRWMPGILAGLLLLPAWAWGQANGAGEPPRTISVTGESLVNVVPDEVSVQFGVETFDANLDEAKSANDAASAKLVKAIKDTKLIEEKHLQADHMQIEVVYRPMGPREGIAGYLARRGYSVVLKNPKEFEKLIDTALKNGANRLMGFEFRTTELRKHRDVARSLAIKAAKEKAIALAKDLDCRIGSPRTINESGGYYGYWGSSWGGYRGAMSQNTMQDSGAAASAGGEAMPLGQIGVRAQVNVTFDLIPGAPAAEGKRE